VRSQLDGKGMRREEIGYAVRGFTDGDEHAVFWGYFPAYDWIAFCWLFGSMDELPFHYPQLCLDIKQWAIELGDPELPHQMGQAPRAARRAMDEGCLGVFSLPSLPLRENAEPRVTRTLISSVQLNQPLSRSRSWRRAADEYGTPSFFKDSG
jgi:hypothetical protein